MYSRTGLRQSTTDGLEKLMRLQREKMVARDKMDQLLNERDALKGFKT